MTTRMRILIVDDYKENIRALSELIASDTIETFSALNADEALELIAKHDFGLLLLDVQMPGMSGFDLAKIIRSVKKYRSLPIIFVTASKEDSSLIFQGYQSGAVDLLFKPLDPNTVRAKVQVFVELAQQRTLLQLHVEELERLRIEAEGANIAKSQFLANMSHEIRTPLAAVMGFAELLAKNQPDNPQAKEYVEAIERNGKLLMSLIDNILDLSKIEAGKWEQDPGEMDLAELLRDIETTLSFKAQEKGIQLSFKKPQSFVAYLGDITRIKQILLNIIGNAIKFTLRGKVEVSVDIQSLKDNKDLMTLQVKDQGVGLTADQTQKLFKLFGQADSSTRRQFGGSGLGLIISRQIAQSMGGNVTLLSTEPGVGTTFQIQIPLERWNATKEKSSEGPGKKNVTKKKKKTLPLTGKELLIVDDSPDNLTLLSLFLNESGARLTMEKDGLTAIEAVKKKRFDLILMDIQMPLMDGHEATQKIRQLGFDQPIIAFTAHAIRSEHDRCLKAGCNSVLTKPIARAALLKELERFLS